MTNLLSSLYPWTKAIHIIAMTAWMAGLFYLPRLFVYHVERGANDPVLHETFCVMESKLLRLIMNPAMIVTWIFGLMMLLTPGLISWSQDFWIYPKLVTVAGLTWFHHWLGLRCKDFADGTNTHTGRTYRLMNEIPTIGLIIIVVMVVVRPI